MPNSCSAARIPGYRNHKASGQAVVTLNGRDVYLGPYGSPASHEAYRLEIRNWLSAVEGPALQSRPAEHVNEAPQAITTVEVIAAYLRFAKTYYRKNGKPTNEVRMIIAALVQDLNDAATATVVAAERRNPGVYLIVNDHPLLVRQWLPALAAWLNAPPPPKNSVEEALPAADADAIYYPRLKAVECSFRNGTMVLHGKVPSYYHKQLAQEALRHVRHVYQVVNNLEVSA
jgi:hypothetical protein